MPYKIRSRGKKYFPAKLPNPEISSKVLYIEPKYDPKETRTVFEGLSLGNIKLKLGNYVAVKGKSNKKRIGKLLEVKNK